MNIYDLNIAQLTWVDYLIVIIFALSVLGGFARGLVKEVISLLTLIAAVVIACLFASPMAAAITNTPHVQQALNQASNSIGLNAAEPVSYIAIGICFALLFAGTLLLGWIIRFFINLAVTVGMLGIGNRLLGAVFGFCRGFIINLVIIFLVQLTSFSTQAAWQQSQLVPQFQKQVEWLGKQVAPNVAELQTRFGETLQKVNQTLSGMRN
jgi:membrane protein required for colicin V production